MPNAFLTKSSRSQWDKTYQNTLNQTKEIMTTTVFGHMILSIHIFIVFSSIFVFLYSFFPSIFLLREARWPHGTLVRSFLRVERSGFELRPGTLILCCVLRQDTLLPQCLSPPRCINGYWRTYCWG